MDKPRIYKEKGLWVIEIGDVQWDCTSWRAAMFAVWDYRTNPLSVFWRKGCDAPVMGRIAGGDVIRRNYLHLQI